MTIKTSHKILGGAVLLTAASVMLLRSSNRKIPNGVSAVRPFDVNRYAGKWYEIARLDFKHEKGLNNTMANYSLNDDGTITVVNRGYDVKNRRWKETTGKAKFVNEPNEAMLKVSFFGPFYSGYNVIAIDHGYRFALVAGESLEYLWLLSRETTMPEDVKQNFLAQAKASGFDTDELVWVRHDQQ